MPRGPQFKAVDINLAEDPGLYEEIMQDIHIDKTGRYELVSDPKRYMDMKEGEAHVVLEYIDNGTMDAEGNEDPSRF